jgi:NAD(P)-dependent dehydrogenase (short-subunit alcohol dehydrogenase family)
VRLKDRIAVITGAGSGIGRASAKEFAREGARVLVADINFDGVRETAEHIQSAGGFARAVITDVADASSVKNLVEETLKAFPQVHVLLNNAARCAGYCATKGAIIALTKAMAIDYGKEGIRVNCICPGYIDSGLTQSYFEAQPDPGGARAVAGKLHALWRIGQPEEVARLAVFLASDEASFMTGSAVVVDGGFGSGLPPQG